MAVTRRAPATLEGILPRLPAQLLRLWHVLSLDAPSVAALWCWTIARAVHVHLPVAAPLMLALGTWLLYVADRLLDGLLAPQSPRLRERHLFHRRYRPAFLAASACGVVALAVLVERRMPAFVIRAYVVLGICALLYLLLVHIRMPNPFAQVLPRLFPRLFPKELAVGVIFAAATVIPTWERLRRSVPGQTGAPLLLLLPIFAALCTLNCIAIEVWETATDPVPDSVANSTPDPAPDPVAGWGDDRAHGRFHSATLLTTVQPHPIHPLTRVFGDHLTLTSLLLAAIAGVAAGILWLRLAAHPAALVAVALAVSALLFAALDRRRSLLSPGALRIAADAVLLTPVFLIPVLG